MLAYFRDVPAISKLYVVQQVLTVCGAVAWLVVFVLLALVELPGLVWLGDGARPGDSGARDVLRRGGCARLVALIMAPAVCLFVSLLLLDIIPAGLKKAVAPKLATQEGRGFVKVLPREREGGVHRAAEEAKAAAQAKAEAGQAKTVTGQAKGGAGDSSPRAGQPDAAASPPGGAQPSPLQAGRASPAPAAACACAGAGACGRRASRGPPARTPPSTGRTSAGCAPPP